MRLFQEGVGRESVGGRRVVSWTRWTLAICAVVALGLVSNDLGDLAGDNAQYILLAQALATGQGYRTINEPGAPPHIFWPPLFPLMLVPVVAIVGIHYGLLHAVVVVSGLVGLWLWVCYLRGAGVGERTIAWVLVVIGLSPVWAGAVSRILSDIPYAMWVCGALLAASCVFRQLGRWGWWWLTAACVLASVMTRTIGWATALAVASAWCDRRIVGDHRSLRIQGLALLGLVGLIAGAWALRSQLVASDQMSYATHFLARDPLDWDRGRIGLMGIAQRIASNSWFYVLGTAEVFWHGSRWMPLWLVLPVSLAGSMAVVVGAWRRWRGQPGVADWCMVWHLAVFAIWPFAEDRFVVPLVPMLALYVVEGVGAIGASAAGRWRARRCRVSAVLLAVWLITNGLGLSGQIVAAHSGSRYYPVEQEYLAALRWIREHTQPGDVILAQRPPLVALATGRQAVRYPYTRDTSAIMAMVDRYGVDYVFLDSISRMNRQFVEPMLLEHQARFELAAIVGHHGIFRVRQDVGR